MVRSSDRSIVRPFVHPNNLCSAVMLPKFRSFVRPIIRSFVRSFIVPIHRSSFVHSPYSSFIVPIHRSSFVHSPYSSFIVRSYDYSPLLFTVTIHHRHYPSLLFIDHPITPDFNCSSIILSSSPETCQTNIPVIQTSVTVIFLPIRTFHLVTHPKFL
jgi:hypothetical protein